MKVAVMTLCYNEEETIEAVLKNWGGIVDKHLVLLSETPWHGDKSIKDKSEMIALSYGAQVIKGKWSSETAQRNEALALLHDYDYVLIVDADELYEDPAKILENLNGEDCYRVPSVATYWKTTDYVLDPPDRHKPVIAVNPKKILFKEHRIPNTEWQPLIDIEMHHLSYCKSPEKIKDKIEQFEHYDQIKPNWYKEKWLNWTMDMEDIHPYNLKPHRAIYKPLPEELKKLI